MEENATWLHLEAKAASPLRVEGGKAAGEASWALN